jgi:RimJ/RimL family protein N-acetyltransferase
MDSVTLRGVMDDDLPLFFEWNRDEDSVQMAAFTSADPSDRAVFDAHWARTRSDPRVVIATILLDGQPVGSVLTFPDFGSPEVSYWIDRAHWGKGIASRALALFLKQVDVRPMFGRAASDNVGSIRVLERNGFREIGRETNFADGRGAETEETIFVLDGHSTE